MMKNEKQEKKNSRVEKHLIRTSSPYFSKIYNFCHLAKNLYNHANYVIRQNFIRNGIYTNFGMMDKILKADLEHPDYRAMPTAQSAQQVLRLLDQNWRSFFVAIKDWKEHPEKYTGRPKLPKYKKKDGTFVLTMTSQECKIKGEVITFPKMFGNFTVKPMFINKSFKKFQQIRFIPSNTEIILEVVYELEQVQAKNNNGRYASIDLGVDNLMTVVTNTEQRPFIINGEIPKSRNQFCNKEVSRRKSLCKKMNGKETSKAIQAIIAKRNRRIIDYMHKASRYLIDKCAESQIYTIIIGKSKGWKQESKLSKKINQEFVQMPFARLIEMIQYKAKDKGITVILKEESYTSGTSFLDNEKPTKKNYDKSRRIHRGLFRANDGRLINADVNGAFQIMRKVFPNVTADGIAGVCHPCFVVNLTRKD